MFARGAHRRRAGFTLVEVLVVIGIIALLLSILLPAIRKAIGKSRDLNCSSNLRQIGIAFFAYSGENKGCLPPPWATIAATGESVPWQLALWKYLFHQPQPVTSVTSSDTFQFLVGTVFTCPRGILDPRPAFGQSSTYLSLGYDMNFNLPGPIPPPPARGPASTNVHLGTIKRLDRVRGGSSTLLAADGVDGTVGLTTAGDRDGITASSGNEFDEAAHPIHQNRHPKGNIYCLMCDGSVSPKQWIFNKTEIPMPPDIAASPVTFSSTVQMFWYGHTPDANGD